MPQGLLQVDRFVTPQNLMCTVSGAINRAKSHGWKILPVTLTHSRFCREKFLVTQWNQDFSYTEGGGGYPELSAASCLVRPLTVGLLAQEHLGLRRSELSLDENAAPVSSHSSYDRISATIPDPRSDMSTSALIISGVPTSVVRTLPLQSDAMSPLILGSASPRRSELLRNAGIAFEVDPANVPRSLCQEKNRSNMPNDSRAIKRERYSSDIPMPLCWELTPSSWLTTICWKSPPTRMMLRACCACSRGVRTRSSPAFV